MAKEKDNQLNLNNKAEVKTETKEEEIKGEKVWIIQYLHDNRIPLSRMSGFLRFTKVPEDATIDRKWADQQLKEYKSRVGGGI